MQVPFVGYSYTMPSLPLDAQDCINWYVVKDATGKNPEALRSFSGSELFSAETTTQCRSRGAFVLKNKHYSVIDNKFYQILPDGVRIELGTMKGALNRVKLIANANQIGIFDGEYGYVYQLVKTTARDVGDFFQITNTTSTVGDATFVGTGLDDLTTGGAYTGSNDITYRVEIQAVPAGKANEFRWSDTDGQTWNAENIDITSGAYDLNNGVQITFNNTTGHTKNDYWTFDVTSDSAFYPPIIPSVLDGVGIFPQQASNRFFITGENDFSSINALDFAFESSESDSKPSNIVASIVINQEIWFFCDDKIVPWYETGESEFPYERRSNLVMPYGCLAPHSISVSQNNSVLWFGTNDDGQRGVFMCEGYQVSLISTEPMNTEFAKYETVDDAFAFTMFENGHLFYFITFPTENRTWACDLTTRLWFERRTRYEPGFPTSNQYVLGRWRANSFVHFNGMNLIGDWESGNIYKITPDVYEEDGKTMICQRTTQHIQNDGNRVSFEWLQIDMDAGNGLVTGQGSDPEAMISISKDGGKSWNGEIWKKMGKIGETKRRIKLNRLGTARNWTFRLTISDPVFRTVLGAYGETEVFQE